MRLVENFGANRPVHVLGLLGLLALASGCDSGSTSTGPAPAPAASQAKENSERDARLKAFGGKSTIPTKEAPK
jgi:hypothetical protein